MNRPEFTDAERLKAVTEFARIFGEFTMMQTTYEPGGCVVALQRAFLERNIAWMIPPRIPVLLGAAERVAAVDVSGFIAPPRELPFLEGGPLPPSREQVDPRKPLSAPFAQFAYVRPIGNRTGERIQCRSIYNAVVHGELRWVAELSDGQRVFAAEWEIDNRFNQDFADAAAEPRENKTTDAGATPPLGIFTTEPKADEPPTAVELGGRSPFKKYDVVQFPDTPLVRHTIQAVERKTGGPGWVLKFVDGRVTSADAVVMAPQALQHTDTMKRRFDADNEHWESVGDLVDYFRNHDRISGDEGDDHCWTPSQTAVVILRRQREKLREQSLEIANYVAALKMIPGRVDCALYADYNERKITPGREGNPERIRPFVEAGVAEALKMNGVTEWPPKT